MYIFFLCFSIDCKQKTKTLRNQKLGHLIVGEGGWGYLVGFFLIAIFLSHHPANHLSFPST